MVSEYRYIFLLQSLGYDLPISKCPALNDGNDDVINLYNRVQVGAKVIVLPQRAGRRHGRARRKPIPPGVLGSSRTLAARPAYKRQYSNPLAKAKHNHHQICTVAFRKCHKIKF